MNWTVIMGIAVWISFQGLLAYLYCKWRESRNRVE
jgi:hypothetical protein